MVIALLPKQNSTVVDCHCSASWNSSCTIFTLSVKPQLRLWDRSTNKGHSWRMWMSLQQTVSLVVNLQQLLRHCKNTCCEQLRHITDSCKTLEHRSRNVPPGSRGSNGNQKKSPQTLPPPQLRLAKKDSAKRYPV